MDQPLSIDHPDHGGEQTAEDTSPFEKYDPLIHGGIGHAAASSGRRSKANQKKEVLNIAFVKKYIQYAKARPAPTLTKGAADWIVDVYARLRNEDLEEKGKRVCISLIYRLIDIHRLYVDISSNRSYPRNPDPSIHRARQSSIVPQDSTKGCSSSRRDPPVRPIQESPQACSSQEAQT